VTNSGGEAEWKVFPGVDAVGRAGLSLTTRRLKQTETLGAEPLGKMETMPIKWKLAQSLMMATKYRRASCLCIVD
jgi:hypothetical protein